MCIKNRSDMQWQQTCSLKSHFLRHHPQKGRIFYFNLFFPKAPFLYLLKTEKCKVFWCFQGVEKGCVGTELVNRLDSNHLITGVLKPRRVIFSRRVICRNVSNTFWRSTQIMPMCIPLSRPVKTKSVTPDTNQWNNFL